MMRIEGDKDALYQYDSSQRIILSNEDLGAKVHFSNKSTKECKPRDTYEEDGLIYADVPDSLLQENGIIKVYIYVEQENKAYTTQHYEILVLPRKEPPGYVNPDDEDEILNYEKLEERVDKLSEDIADLKENGSGGGASLDVQINGTSIVENGVANIPLANESGYGVVRVKQAYGINVESGTIYIMRATDGELDIRNSQWKPITPANLDYAVKTAMCDGKGAEWTSEEKASARDRLGLGWKYIDTVEVADVTLMEITFPQEYDEFMIIGDVEGSGTSIIYPRATYFYNNGASQQVTLSFSDFYPSDKKEHFELVFEKISLENDTLFRMSGFETTNFVSQKMKQNVQSTGWVRKFDSTNTYQCHRWYGVEISRTITNAKFEVYAR